ncbi:MAG: WYL domain-containing protein [Oscillospiraceae bacterium]|nr:WYL domain-containing protein [Oscillospiraceae bacterium]
MYPNPPKKMLIMNILDILKRYTDEDHRLSQKEIADILEKEYNMKVDRKAIKRNLMHLIDFGYELEYSESIRSQKSGEEDTMYSDWYFIRDFTDAELRLLIDSLLFSKHIPYSQCKQLIEKLEGLSNIYFKSKVKHIRNMPETMPENKQLFYNIDILDEAISKNRQVSFKYNEYDIDKKMRPRKNSKGEVRKYTVNPYQMAATNGRYYLICNLDNYDGVSNYRLDRISDIELLESKIKDKKKVKGAEHGFDLPRHMAENIYMFGGESKRVLFRAKRYIIADILDWFGKDVKFFDPDENEVTASVSVCLDAMFYWALQYGEHIEVLEPEGLRERVGAAAKAISDKYSM